MERGCVLKEAAMAVVWTLCTLLCLAGVGAIPHDLMYPYGPDAGDASLPPGDDLSSDEIRLQVPVVFFDTTHYAIYINTNGHVSFESELPYYQGDQVLPFGRKLIAPFLADVDTTAVGRIYYRQITDGNSTELRRAMADVHDYFAGQQGFRPRAVLVVTWDRVGRYNQQNDKMNTFQLVIVTDGTDSYAFFLYVDGVDWWFQGEGKTSALQQDVPAQAGFDRGDRRPQQMATLPYSGVTSAFVYESNVNIPGLWMFQIGNTGPGGDVVSANLNTGEEMVFTPGTGPMTCLEGARTCHMNARCVDHERGFCCQCVPPFYGNGKDCLEPKVAQRLNGRVTGTVNGARLADLDMHTYVVTTDGRTYSAISRVPKDIAPAMLTLSSLGGAIGWLFAVPTSPMAANGYTFTGGVFNRTAVVNFVRGEQTTHSVRIMQQFLGHDALNNLRMETHIDGDLPAVGTNVDVKIDDYNENYKRIQPGVIKSFSTRTYRVNDVAFRYTWDQTLSFEECEADPTPKPSAMRLSVSRNYVRHTTKDQVVRYASSNKVAVMTGSDPCRDAMCHRNADCVPGDFSHRCVCKAGYQGDGTDCQDIDECRMGSACDANARCFNTDGSFQCQCNPGFIGDGQTCERDEARCGEGYCGQNAQCVAGTNTLPQCACNTGFRGDGQTCTPVEFKCNEADICSENAQCVYDEDLREYECQCLDDFSGDGYTCEPTDRADCSRCSPDADCNYDLDRLVYRCDCKAGFTGNGQSCSPIDRCGDCDVNAECEVDPATRQSRCTCRPGFYGDGRRCQQYDCRRQNVCDQNANCDFDPDANTFVCVCPRGFTGDGFVCEAEGCDLTRDCDVNARCESDRSGRYTCRCEQGYEGDGKTCSRQVVPCNQVNNCDRNAECLYDPDAMSYRCRCSRGFEGDGLTCTQRELPDCRSRDHPCDRNAACIAGADGRYVCVCNANYRGDGRTCTAATREGERLVYARGRKVFSVSTQPQPGDYGTQLVFTHGLPTAVDIDCDEGHIYFSDAYNGRIHRATLNGSDNQVIIDGLKSPEGLVVDYVSRTLFFTDSVLDIVAVAPLDGSYRKTLFDTDLVNPRAIVADVSRGKIYWTDWNRGGARIEAANMDGTGREVLVDSDLRLPNGLAFDHYARQLCWADAGTRQIECVRADGLGRRVVSSAPDHPFGMTILEGVIYWTDWRRRAISGVRQSGGEEVEAVAAALGGNGRFRGMAAVRERCPRASNSCAFNNGGCGFLCLPTPDGGRTCACPDDGDPRACQEDNRT